MKNFALRTLWHILPPLLALIAVFIIKTVDQSFPVIDSFKIVHQEISPNGGVIIDGTLNKRRDCKFESMVAYTDDTEPVHIRMVDKPEGAFPSSRAVRVQLWGPWEVMANNDDKTIEIMVVHRCHPLWDVTSQLTKFTIVRVQNNVTESRVEDDR